MAALYRGCAVRPEGAPDPPELEPEPLCVVTPPPALDPPPEFDRPLVSPPRETARRDDVPVVAPLLDLVSSSAVVWPRVHGVSKIAVYSD